jgi:hypothetical protein
MDQADELDAVCKYDLDNILNRPATTEDRPEETFVRDILRWVKNFYENIISKDFGRLYQLLHPNHETRDPRFYELRDGIKSFTWLLSLQVFGWILGEQSPRVRGDLRNIAAWLLGLRISIIGCDFRSLMDCANDYADRECLRLGYQPLPRPSMPEQHADDPAYHHIPGLKIEAPPETEVSFTRSDHGFQTRTHASSIARDSEQLSGCSSAILPYPQSNLLPRLESGSELPPKFFAEPPCSTSSFGNELVDLERLNRSSLAYLNQSRPPSNATAVSPSHSTRYGSFAQNRIDHQ